MTILFHRPTPWSSNVRCSTKTYSKLFAKQGHSVIYLQTSINLLHWITRKGYFKTWKEGSRLIENVWVICAISIIPYYDQFPALSKFLVRYSYKTCLPPLRKLVMKSGFSEPDIIWTTVPGSSVLKELFPRAKIVFHCIDNYSAYRGQNIIRIEEKDYKSVDHIFVIGESLKKHVLSLTDRKDIITNLGQGVNIELYQTEYELPMDLANVKGPIAIWVGVVKKFDVDFLRVIANEMKKKGGSVVLIGPVSSSFQNSFKCYENIKFLGPKSNEDIPKYLMKADIGLMPYNRENQDIYKGQHPLKLYEYAAAKLPIISTWHDEYKTLIPPVLLINSEKDIPNAIKFALENSGSLGIKSYDFALKHTWDFCKKKAEKVIENLI